MPSTPQDTDVADPPVDERDATQDLGVQREDMTTEGSDDSGTFIIDHQNPPLARVQRMANSSSESSQQKTPAEDSRCGFIPGYSILGSLGQGGMGVVYQAIQERLQRVVALKVLRPNREGDTDFVARFEREAMAVARLNHPNIVTAYDYGEAEGRFYLAIEYIQGRDGAELIAYDGRICEREAISMIRDAVLGLSHALSHGIIHRDVKPANLMLTSQATQDASGGALSGRLKVTDLGLAQIREDAHELNQVNFDTGKIVGTPSYMAPEQARGEDLDFRCDIYALGATLFHFLTGIKPFDADTPLAALGLKANTRLAHPQDLEHTISDDTLMVLDRMMAPNREHRYQSYEDLLFDLIALMAGKKPHTACLPHNHSSFEKPRIRRSILRNHRAAPSPHTPLTFRLRLTAPPESQKKRWLRTALGYAIATGLGFALAWFLGK